jgi:hypothetical protein
MGDIPPDTLIGLLIVFALVTGATVIALNLIRPFKDNDDDNDQSST